MKLAFFVSFLAATIIRGADAPITHEELVRRTQELYDAIVPGDQSPWKNTLPTTASSRTEKGRLFDKPN